jgi:hypothetical protein
MEGLGVQRGSCDLIAAGSVCDVQVLNVMIIPRKNTEIDPNDMETPVLRTTSSALSNAPVIQLQCSLAHLVQGSHSSCPADAPLSLTGGPAQPGARRPESASTALWAMGGPPPASAAAACVAGSVPAAQYHVAQLGGVQTWTGPVVVPWYILHSI